MIIKGDSVTECWLRALISIADGSGSERSPFIANFKTNGEAPEYRLELESDLNKYLQDIGKNTIETTASTIFPKSLAGGNQSTIFKRFDKIWPYVKKDTQNRKGHYFRRLYAFTGNDGKPVNQLQHIIDTYNGNDERNAVHRRSALIALTFDPNRDHTSQTLRGFPCMQQICLVPNGKTKKLHLNAFYAMQHLCNRAYGNYLGLESLGNFMAGEMGLELEEINCIASVIELKMTKQKAKEIANKYRRYVQ
ncbi:MAG: hypothetical protein K6L80_09810 [Agarilytica sp.]